MEDKLQAVGALNGATGGPETAQIFDLVRQSAQEAQSISNMSDALQTAVSKVSVAPGSNASGQDLRGELTGGVVGEAKLDVMSDVTRPGVTPHEAPPQDQTAEIEQRFQKLYLELTNFQVAWAIARRTQQDISQLLRGN